MRSLKSDLCGTTDMAMQTHWQKKKKGGKEEKD